MRPLPRNSPEAAGRLLALVVMADGRVRRAELAHLQELQAERRLGLPPGRLATLLQQLCQDLLATAPEATELADALDDATLLALLDEVDDPLLQREVFTLGMAATRADDDVDEGELTLLGTMIVRWGLFEAPEVRPVHHVVAAAEQRRPAP